MNLRCMLLAALVSAGNAAAALEPKVHTDEFFRLIMAKEYTKAYDHLFAGSPILEDKSDMVSDLKTETAAYLPLHGEFLGVEFVRDETVGSSLRRFVVLLKTEKTVIAFELFFYRPKDDWFLVNFRFSDKQQIQLLQKMN